MNAPGLFLVLMVVGLVVALAILGLRYLRLRSDVDGVLDRVDVKRRSPHATRALYRAMREVEQERDTAEQEAARLRVAIDSADLGLVIADRRGSIIFTNPAANSFMDGRLGDTVVRSRLLLLIERVTATGAAEELEFDLYTPVRRVLSLRAVPFASDDRKGHAVLVYVVDLTDRRRVDAMRRDFVANAGHELKTPIGGLSVLAEAIADTDDPEARRRLSSRLIAESTRMARLVDDILTLAAVESLETPHLPVAVAEVLAEADRAVSVAAEDQKVTLVSKSPPPDVLVGGDKKQLISAVTNLLDNAVKYTIAEGDDHGTVWYRGWSDGGDIFIEVEDHGIGISDHHQERVFERFYRVDRARSRESGGTGLGLAIVRNIARTHGGDVSVNSELGVGSVFTMRLPILDPANDPEDGTRS